MTKVGGDMYGIYAGNGTFNLEMDSAAYHARHHGYLDGELAAEGPLTEIMLILVEEKGEPDAKYKQAMAEYEKALAEYNKYFELWCEWYRTSYTYILRENADVVREHRENPQWLWTNVIKPQLKAEMAEYEDGNPRPPKPKKPQNKNAYYAKGKGAMNWNWSEVKNHFVEHAESGDVVTQTPEQLRFMLSNFEFEVIIYANGNGVVKIPWGSMVFKARLTKSVELVDID